MQTKLIGLYSIRFKQYAAPARPAGRERSIQLDRSLPAEAARGVLYEKIVLDKFAPFGL